MNGFQLFISEWVLGYLLQCGGFILGICSVAKKKIKPIPLIITVAILVGVVYVVRTLGMINFGVHTMIILFLANILCVIFLKIDVRPSILGSLLVTMLILLGEFVNLGILMLIFGPEGKAMMDEDALFKAWAGVPGNVVLLIVVVVGYYLRVVKGKNLTDGNAR